LDFELVFEILTERENTPIMDTISAWDTPTKYSSSQMTPGSSGTPLSSRHKSLRVETPSPFGRLGSGSGSDSARGDRFIPRRRLFSSDIAHYDVVGTPLKENLGPDEDGYMASLQENMFGDQGMQSPLPLASAPRTPMSPADQRRSDMLSSIASPPVRTEKLRSVSNSCASSRTLLLPGLQDDYYLNLLGWSCRGTLAIALSDTVYLWTEEAGIVQKITPVEAGNMVTSLSWSHDGTCLAIGSSNAKVQLWDTTSAQRLRVLGGHTLRVGTLAWNGNTLTSGSRDTTIINHDVRLAAHRVATLSGHRQEVCGMQWSRDGGMLASGGNDNLLNIWDYRNTNPRFTISDHTAAVKAIAWSPFQSTLLASGGGTADQTIRLWNAATGSCLETVQAKSQVCSLLWGHRGELVSAHGFAQNQICVWQYPSMRKVTELRGHSARVLHLAMSPDGTTIASAAGDETLCFWPVLPGAGGSDARPADSPLRLSLR
jgi:cell division cycle protein 20 (cofactor of APC complex)